MIERLEKETRPIVMKEGEKRPATLLMEPRIERPGMKEDVPSYGCITAHVASVTIGTQAGREFVKSKTSERIPLALQLILHDILIVVEFGLYREARVQAIDFLHARVCGIETRECHRRRSRTFAHI